MYVSNLIKQLQAIQNPDEVRVFVQGYDGGFHHARSIVELPIYLNVNSTTEDKWLGPHDDHDPADPDHPRKEPVRGIILSAGRVGRKLA